MGRRGRGLCPWTAVRCPAWRGLCQGEIAARAELLAGGLSERVVEVFVQSAWIALFVVAAIRDRCGAAVRYMH